MSPIIELRGAIPIALGEYELPIWSAYLFSVLGNLVPSIILLWLLEPVSKYLMRHFSLFDRLLTWFFERTRKKHTKKFERWKEFALVILVAIPLPFTGIWTGSICAFIFGVPFLKAFPLLAIGVLIAGLIVTLASLGVFRVIF
jgi:uncharacterized membrane protein